MKIARVGDLKWKIFVLLLLAGGAYMVRKHGLLDLLDLRRGDPTAARTELEMLKTDGTNIVAVVQVIGIGEVTSGVTFECALLRPDGATHETKKGSYEGPLTFGQLQRVEVEFSTGHSTSALPGNSRKVRVESWGEVEVVCKPLSAR